MAGICSAHQGYDVDCMTCNAVPELITNDLLKQELKKLRETIILKNSEIQRYEAAIRKHKGEKGHDRCWLDDVELYKELPEGLSDVDLQLPPREEFLNNCERYHAHRQDPTNPNLTFIRQKDVEKK